MTYADFARRLQRSGVVPDPWIRGQERFRQQPVVLERAHVEAIYAAAEAITLAHEAAVRVCMAHPALLDEFLVLTPVQQLLFRASQPRWHGIARADVFDTAEGPVICELNSDTPTGQPESIVLGEVAGTDHPDLVDPNAGMRARFLAWIRSETRRLRPDAPRTAAIVYPTEFTEDLHFVQLVHHWLEQLGHRVVLGSPFNLGSDASGRITVMGEPVGLVYRHYKTDWWTERLPVWDDADPFDDPLPLVEPLEALLRAEQERVAVVVNPFGSVLTQNKRIMALMHERIDLFPAEAQDAIRRYLPETLRLDAVHPEQLSAERADWVLKTDYGCEGEEVWIGAMCEQPEWDRVLRHALPERWIAQRYFRTTSSDGMTTNYGAWLIAGEAAGLYTRVHPGATDYDALSAPALVRP